MESSLKPSLKPRLPEGWIVVPSKTYPDRVYYFNERTNTATWNLEQIPNFQVKRPSSVSSEGSSACSSKMGTNGGLPPGLPKHSHEGASGADQCLEDLERKHKAKPPACAVVQPRSSCKRKWSTSSKKNVAILKTDSEESSQLKPRKVSLKRPKFAAKVQCSTDSPASTDSGHATFDSETSSLKTSISIPRAISTFVSSGEDKIPVQHAENKLTGYDSSEAMEVDEIDDEEMLIDIQEVREKLKVNPHVICGELTSLSASNQPQQLPPPVPNVIYIVVDTNAFLSDLKLLETLHLEFKDFPFALKFIVPWVVLQELDALKDEKYYKNKKPSISRRAQLAIKFVHSQLSAFGESRFQGQTLAEAFNEKIGNVECNDDRILQCCIFYAKKSPVLLFTNDINLRNKAIVNNVSAKGRDDIIEGVSLLISKLPVKLTPLNAEESKKVQLSRRIAKEVEKSEKIRNQLANILRDVLSVILEAEMVAVYANLWRRIIFKDPPWTIETVLLCYEKHWIAVFGFFLKKPSHEDLLHLKKFFLKKGGPRIPMLQLMIIINISIRLLGCLQVRSDYDGAISRALDMLTKLYSDCGEEHNNITASVPKVKSLCSANFTNLSDRNLGHDRSSTSCTSPNQSSFNPTHCLPSGSSAVTATHIMKTPPLPPHVSKPVPAHELPPPELCLPAADVHSSREIPVFALTESSTQEIKMMITIIWSNIVRFCGMLCDSFGHPHNLHYNTPERIPSQDECCSFLPRLYPVVCRLTKDLRAVLEIASDDPVFLTNCGLLHNSMTNFNESLDLQDDRCFDVSVEAFCAYCQIEANRRDLRDGLWQLVELRGILHDLVTATRPQAVIV